MIKVTNMSAKLENWWFSPSPWAWPPAEVIQSCALTAEVQNWWSDYSRWEIDHYHDRLLQGQSQDKNKTSDNEIHFHE